MRLVPILNLVADVRTSLAVSEIPVPRRIMYAQLGDLRFELVGPIVGLESKRAYTYAQHALIQGKPRLQSIGDELETLSLTLEFKRDFADPVIAYAKLCAAAAAHRAVPLLFAGGQVIGRYVITDISDAIDKTDQLGAVVTRRTKVELVEYVEAQPLEVQSRARRAAANQSTTNAARVAETTPTVHATMGATPPSAVVRGRP